jgi:hypothetical protein
LCVEKWSKTLQKDSTDVEDWMVGVCFEHKRVPCIHEGCFCCVHQSDWILGLLSLLRKRVISMALRSRRTRRNSAQTGFRLIRYRIESESTYLKIASNRSGSQEHSGRSCRTAARPCASRHSLHVPESNLKSAQKQLF